jgi:hypothetical protein
MLNNEIRCDDHYLAIILCAVHVHNSYNFISSLSWCQATLQSLQIACMIGPNIFGPGGMGPEGAHMFGIARNFETSIEMSV